MELWRDMIVHTHERLRIVLLAATIVLLIVVVVVVAIEAKDKVDRLSGNNGGHVVESTLAFTDLVLKPAW